MNSNKKHSTFLEELKTSLPNSSAQQRRNWASIIIEENLSIRKLSDLLFLDYKIASRFLWLLTDVGEIGKQKLKDDLIFLFDRCITLNHIKPEPSFANYWLVCGIPVEKEAEYIDYLFKWLSSSDSNLTTKSRSLFVLFKLTKKYPDMRNELKLVIHEQLDRNSVDFKKRASKILAQLD